MARARRVTDEMLVAAADAVASFVTEDQLKEGRLFPDIKVTDHVLIDGHSCYDRCLCIDGLCCLEFTQLDQRCSSLGCYHTSVLY